jgi:hypothetical protein
MKKALLTLAALAIVAFAPAAQAGEFALTLGVDNIRYIYNDPQNSIRTQVADVTVLSVDGCKGAEGDKKFTCPKKGQKFTFPAKCHSPGQEKAVPEGHSYPVCDVLIKAKALKSAGTMTETVDNIAPTALEVIQ